MNSRDEIHGSKKKKCGLAIGVGERHEDEA
jgi:hypothetical protein